MLVVTPIFEDKQDKIPAVSHMGTGRLQTIRKEWNPHYYGIVEKFGQATGIPILMNTSFNLRGEPIVADHRDAYHAFLMSDLDIVVLGRCVVAKPGVDLDLFDKSVNAVPA